MVSVKLAGINSVNKDYKVFNVSVYRAMQIGLTAVGSELTKQLQKHIQTDVYNAYTPKDYIRRTEHGGLIDSRYMKLSQRSMAVELTYLPSGFNSKYPDNSYKSGDDLIHSIETSHYSWAGTDDIPERHFWNNFVEDAVGTNGWTEQILVKTMNQAEKNLGAIADGRIEHDGNDTIFEQQESLANLLDSNNDSDDGLPY